MQKSVIIDDKTDQEIKAYCDQERLSYSKAVNLFIQAGWQNVQIHKRIADLESSLSAVNSEMVRYSDLEEMAKEINYLYNIFKSKFEENEKEKEV